MLTTLRIAVMWRTVRCTYVYIYFLGEVYQKKQPYLSLRWLCHSRCLQKRRCLRCLRTPQGHMLMSQPVPSQWYSFAVQLCMKKWQDNLAANTHTQYQLQVVRNNRSSASSVPVAIMPCSTDRNYSSRQLSESALSESQMKP